MFYGILFIELMTMEIKTGYLYHIKDEYFDVVNDEKLNAKPWKREEMTNLFYN